MATFFSGMTQILEAVKLALSSVWANKLRSFMMVLGNIVAVTSIIAVVSLIQGMDSYVADAIIKDVGVGTFKIERIGFITDEEEERRAWRRNPNVTMLDARAVETLQPDHRRGDGGVGRQREHHLRRRAAREHARPRRVAPATRSSAATRPSSGRLPSRLEVERGRPVVLLGFDTAEKLFKGRNPIDRVIQINGVHFRVAGRQREEGLGLRQLAGRVRADPAAAPSSTSSARAARSSSRSSRSRPNR